MWLLVHVASTAAAKIARPLPDGPSCDRVRWLIPFGTQLSVGRVD